MLKYYVETNKIYIDKKQCLNLNVNNSAIHRNLCVILSLWITFRTLFDNLKFMSVELYNADLKKKIEISFSNSFYSFVFIDICTDCSIIFSFFFFFFLNK